MSFFNSAPSFLLAAVAVTHGNFAKVADKLYVIFFWALFPPQLKNK